MTITCIVIALAVSSISGFITWYDTKRRAKKYCAYYNLDFDKFWKDQNKIDYSNPDWDIPYIIPGKSRVFGKYEILEAEIKRRIALRKEAQ